MYTNVHIFHVFFLFFVCMTGKGSSNVSSISVHPFLITVKSRCPRDYFIVVPPNRGVFPRTGLDLVFPEGTSSLSIRLETSRVLLHPCSSSPGQSFQLHESSFTYSFYSDLSLVLLGLSSTSRNIRQNSVEWREDSESDPVYHTASGSTLPLLIWPLRRRSRGHSSRVTEGRGCSVADESLCVLTHLH